MTPAEHAATVRESWTYESEATAETCCIYCHEPVPAHRVGCDGEEAAAALDALQAQAETALEAEYARGYEQGIQLLAAAEAERDRLQGWTDAQAGRIDRLRARVSELEAALREIADSQQATAASQTPDEDLVWRPTYGEAAASRARAALAGEGQDG